MVKMLTSPRGPEFCSKYLGGDSQSFIIKVMENPALSSHIYTSFIGLVHYRRNGKHGDIQADIVMER